MARLPASADRSPPSRSTGAADQSLNLTSLALTLHRAGELATIAFVHEAAADGLAVAARRYAPLQPETLATILSIAVRGA